MKTQYKLAKDQFEERAPLFREVLVSWVGKIEKHDLEGHATHDLDDPASDSDDSISLSSGSDHSDDLRDNSPLGGFGDHFHSGLLSGVSEASEMFG